MLIYAHVSARGDRHLNSFQEYKDGPILDTKLVDWLVNALLCGFFRNFSRNSTSQKWDAVLTIDFKPNKQRKLTTRIIHILLVSNNFNNNIVSSSFLHTIHFQLRNIILVKYTPNHLRVTFGIRPSRACYKTSFSFSCPMCWMDVEV